MEVELKFHQIRGGRMATFRQSRSGKGPAIIFANKFTAVPGGRYLCSVVSVPNRTFFIKDEDHVVLQANLIKEIWLPPVASSKPHREAFILGHLFTQELKRKIERDRTAILFRQL